jgi:hypothetical protein
VRAATVVLLVLILTGVARPANAFNFHSGLRLFPYTGTPGGTVYISGFGLQPFTRLSIMFACPSYSTARPGNVYIVAPQLGPTTNSLGEFAGWTFKIPKLVGPASSACTIYANDATRQGWGPTELGTFYIVPRKALLPLCAIRMCITVTPNQKRATSGSMESVSVQGWAGAFTRVAVSYGGRLHMVQTLILNWNGGGSVRFRVPSYRQSASTVHVTVQSRLGSASGSQSSHFTVVP